MHRALLYTQNRFQRFRIFGRLSSIAHTSVSGAWWEGGAGRRAVADSSRLTSRTLLQFLVVQFLVLRLSALANKPQPPPRGFSIATAKYTYGGTKWTLEGKRVPDNSKEGIAAAEAERQIRKTMSEVTWQSVPQKETKRCEAKGYYKGTVLVESDTSGVKNREAALMMRTHNLQTLGDACRTAGLDPTDKYTRPISASHEVGWRATRSAGNRRPGLEMFGVSEFGIKGSLAKGL